MKKNILRTILKNPELTGLLHQIAAAAGARIWVEDMAGAPLFGTPQPNPVCRSAVSSFEQTQGFVCGCDKAPLIASWLTQWVRQEEGRRKLGFEALHLYRELNLMFGFSEKLASVWGLESIANLALEEAGRLIRFDRAVVLFRSAPHAPLRVLAQTGSTVDWERLDMDRSPEILDLQGGYALFAPLKVNYRTLGAILVLRGEEDEFAAGDLKLLTTLALQSAAAMESTLHFEEATARALEQQRAQLAMQNPFFRKVAAILESRYSDSGFGVEQLSHALHLSPSQLQRKILALTEKTPLQLIRDLRLKKARELLLQSDLSVGEIAWKCGFADPSYFTRIFKKEEGLNPSQWKEAQKPEE